MQKKLLPISAIVPTRDRSVVLSKMFNSLAKQSDQPVEMIVIDASISNETEVLCSAYIPQLATRIAYIKAVKAGAAAQRNQGIVYATQPIVGFFDDDIIFEPNCVRRLWQALQSDERLGGVSAMITNQRYYPPGLASRILFTLLRGGHEKSFAGKVIGPAVNLLPEDREDFPEIVPVEWLNTTCTLYRRDALPVPTFDSVFTGYSLMEDLTLSLRVGRQWHLANARTARIFHDSQPAIYKDNLAELARMDLINRHYVMTQILGRRGLSIYLKLLLWEVFQLMASTVNRPTRKTLLQKLRGKLQGCLEIWQSRGNSVERPGLIKDTKL